MIPIIVIVGPTAVGKSAAAMNLALLFDTEIISADSMQIYKGLDIGTAKPSGENLKKVRHHMISIIEPDVRFSTGEFVKQARPVIEDLNSKGRIPIIVGGTGLYIRALADGLCEAPRADWNIRKSLYNEEEVHGKGHLHNRLSAIDPVSAGRIKQNDTVRIVRALEVYESTGIPLSEIQKGHGFSERSYDMFIAGLTMDRKKLYKKVEERVDGMVEQGLEYEVRRLMDRGGDSLPAMQGLGYKQFAGYIKGEYSLEEAVRLLKRDTKRYAKRQLTWFRRDERIRWYSVRDDMSHMEEIRLNTVKFFERSGP